ncbi:3-hydroxyacyl-ACP dehydratase FabZ family protein [Apilactobacillus xinyiensis]|uniref:Beta-hydroxyacyl-ACP dehydratase n=1 Tax=Apilactobacillus xinyiensis TaxID=2841032 RepID=A0ABT0I0X9_9LACO|nr:3-hydroxyacyl-ACP dehydratase FabZ family protein [Apilactobacillus xinyiensis]MCK8624486.1 beta-hydroxyacyl-ACP dehydratase [Apilactobacillus xinyiensis]MCL0312081.1 beta-hydroxyacyl-ACP dehydratase [Apilactobacillus xinyiensis]MCL0318647.1 beta-hydroxyacyl-ACP dehydratase [Apilactobacillus xinyiensis]MCL0330417.1 beta-hydroxyacyl-ACP dehydratase [Apilactobacillus xinyiensis]
MEYNVQEFIPQRYPFQMIDKIEEVKPGEGAKATKLLNVNEWFFQNQHKEFGMPRPLAMEMLAQTGVVSLLSMPEYKGRNVFFGGIKNATFEDSFRPGDKLDLAVEMIKLKRNIGEGHGTITRDGKIICEANLIFAIE